jgi:hypothetical protein
MFIVKKKPCKKFILQFAQKRDHFNLHSYLNNKLSHKTVRICTKILKINLQPNKCLRCRTKNYRWIKWHRLNLDIALLHGLVYIVMICKLKWSLFCANCKINFLHGFFFTISLNVRISFELDVFILTKIRNSSNWQNICI